MRHCLMMVENLIELLDVFLSSESKCLNDDDCDLFCDDDKCTCCIEFKFPVCFSPEFGSCWRVVFGVGSLSNLFRSGAQLSKEFIYFFPGWSS